MMRGSTVDVVLVGSVYERSVPDGSEWRTERRRVLDSTGEWVFYQVLYDEPDGTCVERDETKDQHQVSTKEWREWAKLARKCDAG